MIRAIAISFLIVPPIVYMVAIRNYHSVAGGTVSPDNPKETVQFTDGHQDVEISFVNDGKSAVSVLYTVDGESVEALDLKKNYSFQRQRFSGGEVDGEWVVTYRRQHPSGTQWRIVSIPEGYSKC